MPQPRPPHAKPITTVGAVAGYELRRHLGILLLGWTLLAIPPLVHRLTLGRWLMGTDWHRLSTRFVLDLVAPTLVALMAASGWARERHERTLEWLYAHPLSSLRIFAIRASCLVLAIGVWVVGSLLIYHVSPRQLFDDELLAGAAPIHVGLWLLLMVAALGTGLLASAVSTSSTQAVGRWLFGGLVIGLSSNLVFTLIPTRRVVYLGWSTLGPLASMLFLGIVGFGCLGIAERTMARAPAEIRWRSVGGGLAVVLLLAHGAVAAVQLLPLLADDREPALVRDLGDGARLELVQAKALEEGIYHPRIRSPEGVHLFRLAFVSGDRVFPHPASGRVLLRDSEGIHPQAVPWARTNSRWILLDRDGNLSRLELDPGSIQDPLGWSPDGSRFAWRTLVRERRAPGGYQARHLLILDPDLGLREVRVSGIPAGDPNRWTAAWVADERLLVTTEARAHHLEVHFAPRFTHHAWWMVIDTDGRSLGGPHPLPIAGRRLFSPALSPTPEDADIPVGHFSPGPLSVTATEAYVLLAGFGAGRVAALDLDGSNLRLGPDVGWDPGPFDLPASEASYVTHGYVSLGRLDDGTLVWTGRTAPGATTVFAVDDFAGEPRAVCLFEHDPAGVGGFRGATEDGWAWWADGQERRLFGCHPASGRSTRLTDLGPLGARSVDVGHTGILGLDGWIDPGQPRRVSPR